MTSVVDGPHVQNYGTPWYIVRAVERDTIGEPFKVDVAAEPWSAKASYFYTREVDGLRARWLDASWCNPEYGDQADWLARAAWWADRGVRSALLVMVSTSASYWRSLVHEKATTDLYEGRIPFLDPKTRRPVKGTSFASALVLYGPGFAPGVVRWRSARTGELISHHSPPPPHVAAA